jgi:hypothetical protein
MLHFPRLREVPALKNGGLSKDLLFYTIHLRSNV